jgi:hypothetical protein
MSALKTFASTRLAVAAVAVIFAVALPAAMMPRAYAAPPTVTRSQVYASLSGSGFTPLGTLSVTASGSEMMPTTDMRIVAPAGWFFDTSTGGVLFSVTGDGLRDNGLLAGSLTATASEIRLPVTAASMTGDVLTIAGIKVKPASTSAISGNVGISLDGNLYPWDGPDDVAVVASLIANPLDRPLSDMGINAAVWVGGSVDQLAAAMELAGGVSVTTFVDGAAVVFIPGAPDYVNAAFRAMFPNSGAGTIVFVAKYV